MDAAPDVVLQSHPCEDANIIQPTLAVAVRAALFLKDSVPLLASRILMHTTALATQRQAHIAK